MDRKFISLRERISGSLPDFIEDSGLGKGQFFEEGLFELVNRIKHYKEEGKSFYPEIFLFKSSSFDHFRKIVGTSEFITFNTTQKADHTFSQGLKKCAPLSRGGWNIFFSISDTDISFGVFKAGTQIISVTPYESVIGSGVTDNHYIVVMKQIRENAVEITTNSHHRLEIDFSTNKDNPLRGDLRRQLMDALCEGCEPELQERLKTVYNESIDNAIKEEHGFLVAVCKDDKAKEIEQLKDGTYFPTNVSIKGKLALLKSEKEIDRYSDLLAYRSLLTGMLLSDGITILNESGDILGYNIFIKNDESQDHKQSGKIIGGARKRAFACLRELVDQDILKCAFIQSQDGFNDFYIKAKR